MGRLFWQEKFHKSDRKNASHTPLISVWALSFRVISLRLVSHVENGNLAKRPWLVYLSNFTRVLCVVLCELNFKNLLNFFFVWVLSGSMETSIIQILLFEPRSSSKRLSCLLPLFYTEKRLHYSPPSIIPAIDHAWLYGITSLETLYNIIYVQIIF